MNMKIRGSIQTNSEVVELTIDDNRISTIAAANLSQGCDLGDSHLRLAAGFIDLQLNGYGGIDFNDTAITTEQIDDLTRRLWRTGVTSFCPTIVTESAGSTNVAEGGATDAYDVTFLTVPVRC